MAKENVHKGHRQRLKQRFIENGLNGFAEHEIIELLLYYAIPVRDVNEIAHNLINHFGSLQKVLNADYETLKDLNSGELEETPMPKTLMRVIALS